MSNSSPPPVQNPLVRYLNSLRTQSDQSNPSYIEENRLPFLERLRADARWFPTPDELHVETRLDALVEAMAAGDPGVDIVILTGDAGDGKTAVCARLAARLQCSTDLQPPAQVGRWTVLKDASELREGELLEHVSRALAERGRGRGLLVAINEGRLRRLARSTARGADEHASARTEVQRLWASVIEPALQSDLDEAAAAALGENMKRERVVVVNFRHRMHVRGVTPGLLRTWTPPRFWEGSPACGVCPRRDGCTILANVADLRGADVQQRVADVLTAAYYAGQRLPFRRLQAVLALTVTGGLECGDVHVHAGDWGPLEWQTYRAHNMLFPEGSLRRPLRVRGEPVARVLAAADPGAISDDTLDGHIATLVASVESGAEIALDGVRLPAPELRAAVHVRELTRASAEGFASDPRGALADLTRSLRRFRALHGEPRPTGWRRSLDLLEDMAIRGNGEDLQRQVVGALNALQRLGATNEHTLSARQVDPMGFKHPTAIVRPRWSRAGARRSPSYNSSG
ncbi:hypothetical protein BE20_04500 [Sorangium cellulosum]|uniref:Uncharacterized protein n=1 Tax=Sorangium cellulosum TaxID=56 RepID=A0A150T264_SORCE|nr:hypothetical protein BE20_04500 [Sorangium cellulosum]KYF98723.1 hypothetical protein BE18_34795 [Sorangium cellulosum]